MSIKPWHRGLYELLNSDKTVKRARFSNGIWLDLATMEPLDAASYSGWRGRIQQYTEDKIEVAMKAMESDHQRKYARPLFRHWVSLDDTMKACRYFEIGRALGAKFSSVDERAYERLYKRLTGSGRSKVAASVKHFFGQR
jgi:hypothetical protein